MYGSIYSWQSQEKSDRRDNSARSDSHDVTYIYFYQMYLGVQVMTALRTFLFNYVQISNTERKDRNKNKLRKYKTKKNMQSTESQHNIRYKKILLYKCIKKKQKIISYQNMKTECIKYINTGQTKVNIENLKQ